MRIRYIKPGICTNEDLAELGPYAYILFTGLWMMADREGRLEYRPAKIKAAVMPLWNLSVEDVVNLLWKLAEKHMLEVYEVGAEKCVQIVNWKRHQKPHVNEAASTVPPCDAVKAVRLQQHVDGTTKVVPKHNQGSAMYAWGMGNGEPSRSVNDNRSVIGGRGIVRGKTSPPPQNQNGHKPKRAATPPKTTKPPQRKPPQRSPAPKHHASPVLDFAPHAEADVVLVKASLRELAALTHMPPPDDALVLRVLDAGRGATGAVIHQTLCELWKRQRFRSMQSWGLVPLVVGDCFATSGAAS